MPSNQPTIKTRLLLISDTHFLHPTRPNLTRTDLPFHHPLPQATILIHSGDLTSTGLLSQNQLAVSLLRSHPAELKIVIPGNHDVTLDVPFYTKRKPHMAGDEYPEDVDAIRALYTSPEAVKDGIRYLEEGLETFKLSNGARFTVYANAYTPAFCNWAFAYQRDEDRFNGVLGKEGEREVSVVPDFPGVDIMVTHGPPEGILDRVVPRGVHVGCQHLRTAVQRARPRLHVFGHIHEGWGAELWQWPPMERNSSEDLKQQQHQHQKQQALEGERIQTWNYDVSADEEKSWVEQRGRFVDLSSNCSSRSDTTTGAEQEEGEEKEERLVVRHGESTFFVNASIMDVSYKPVNAPWVIDLDLPLGREGGKYGVE